jgi:hypothetical protein
MAPESELNKSPASRVTIEPPPAPNALNYDNIDAPGYGIARIEEPNTAPNASGLNYDMKGTDAPGYGIARIEEPNTPPNVRGIEKPNIEGWETTVGRTLHGTGFLEGRKPEDLPPPLPPAVPLTKTERVLLNATPTEVGPSIWNYIHAADLIHEPADSTFQNFALLAKSSNRNAVKLMHACWCLARAVKGSKSTVPER